MTEPQFLRQTDGLTIGEIVALTGAQAAGDCPRDFRIMDIAPLERAGPRDVTFIDGVKYKDQLAKTHAGACFAGERFAADVPKGVIVLRARAPYRALVTVARALFPGALLPPSFSGRIGVSATALVDSDARLESGVTVDPGAVIGPRAEIGSGTVIGPAAVIGPDVRIGRDCAIGPGTSISNALIGDRVIVHAGARIGQDGFGYLPSPKGHQKVPQVGRVILQDDVEIGANTTIDRGAMRDTMIGDGTKIDNLVQIAHNVSIGRHCIIVSQTGISGSVTIGDYAMLGGQVGMIDHITVGDGAQIAARAGVMMDVPAGARWAGWPAGPGREWMRGVLNLRRMSKSDRGEQGRAEKSGTDE